MSAGGCKDEKALSAVLLAINDAPRSNSMKILSNRRLKADFAPIVRTLYGCYTRRRIGEGQEVKMASSVKRREERLEVRLTPKAKSMLKRAASVERKTVSAFILDKGLEAAAETLADRREFRLNAKQYDAFVAALDAPGKPRARLRVLLTTPSVIE